MHIILFIIILILHRALFISSRACNFLWCFFFIFLFFLNVQETQFGSCFCVSYK